MPPHFTGLTTHSPTDPPTSRIYRGTPCLHQAHSGESGTAAAWRDAESHACLECLQEIRNGRLDLSLDRLAPQHKRIATRFWKRVEVESLDQCWQWKAPTVNDQLYFTWARPELRNNYQFHPILVLNWLTYGDIGRMGTTSLCGNRRCCNPLHNLPKILADEGIKPDIDLEFLQSSRDLLVQQLKDVDLQDYQHDLHTKTLKSRPLLNVLREKAGLISNLPDDLANAQYEKAYRQMLNNYHRKSLDVRNTDPADL